jgi:hypothetical protein
MGEMSVAEPDLPMVARTRVVVIIPPRWWLVSSVAANLPVLTQRGNRYRSLQQSRRAPHDAVSRQRDG